MILPHAHNFVHSFAPPLPRKPLSLRRTINVGRKSDRGSELLPLKQTPGTTSPRASGGTISIQDFVFCPGVRSSRLHMLQPVQRLRAETHAPMHRRWSIWINIQGARLARDLKDQDPSSDEKSRSNTTGRTALMSLLTPRPLLRIIPSELTLAALLLLLPGDRSHHQQALSSYLYTPCATAQSVGIVTRASSEAKYLSASPMLSRKT